MAETIVRIRVEVQTTHDDKDKEIAFDFHVHDGRNGNDIGDSGDIGLGQLWNNDTTNYVEFAVQPFSFEERLALVLDHYYHNPSGGNQGWEGHITVYAMVQRPDWIRVLNTTDDYKLGESGNPRDKHLRFNS